MNYCKTCNKNVESNDNGGRNATSLWCVNCGLRVDGCKPRYVARYFGQLMKKDHYGEILYSIDLEDGQTLVLTKKELLEKRGMLIKFEEQRFTVESLRDLNYFIVMLTDLRDLYNSKKINGEKLASIFDTLMSDCIGYSRLDRGSQYLAEILRKHNETPNFYVREMEKYGTS